MQPAQEDVLTLSQTLDQLLACDSVQVELIPEKKGLFLKHVEYQVTSQASHPETSSTRKHSYRPTPFFKRNLQLNQTVWYINAKQRKNKTTYQILILRAWYQSLLSVMAMTFIHTYKKKLSGSRSSITNHATFPTANLMFGALAHFLIIFSWLFIFIFRDIRYQCTGATAILMSSMRFCFRDFPTEWCRQCRPKEC